MRTAALQWNFKKNYRPSKSASRHLRQPLPPRGLRPALANIRRVGVARAIYDDKAFERMPILADALMDAGCEEEQIISHCRSDGPHVRGCWVVDLVLGKE